MKIAGVNLNLFRTQNISKVTENQQNPFAINNTNNPFAGGLQQDVFQNSSINATKPNFIAQKFAEISQKMNDSMTTFKSNTKEFFAPAISFAGQVRTGFNKLNELTVSDLYNGIKKEISLLSLDKDVRKYVKMPVSDLRAELTKELA